MFMKSGEIIIEVSPLAEYGTPLVCRIIGGIALTAQLN